MASGKRTRSARRIIVRDWLSYSMASLNRLALGPERRTRRTPPGPRQGRFRRWRHSRPFWGGLLLILAGAELVLIPVSGILLHGAIKLVIYIGIGGVFGVLIGLLLITAGLLLWISPAHKTFYAMAGVILAVLSFIASNLGGFFLGMLLGITGGSLAFAWTQDPGADTDTRPLPPATAEADPARGGQHRGASRFTAGAVLPAVLAGSLFTGHEVAHRAPMPTASPGTARQPGSSPGASGSPGADGARAAMIARAAQGLAAPTATTVLTAGSATLNGLAYQGTAKVPVAAGGEQTMMVFTLDSMTLSGNVTTTVTQDGQTTVTEASTLAFSGGITLYATKLSGTLLGIPTTLTPGNVLTVLLQLLNTVTPAVPLTMTDVTTEQPLVMAGGLQAANLSVTS